MKLAKTSVRSIDLDDLARQLREVAIASLPEGDASTGSDHPHDDAPLDPPRSAAREKALRSIAGGLAHMPRSLASRQAEDEGFRAELRIGAARADLAAADLDASIRELLATDL